MPEPALRIVLAEDHYLVREGIRQLLELHSELRVVAAVADATALLAVVDAERPDVVITDIRMPPGHHTEGIEAAHRIRERHPDIGVVVLSAHAEHSYALELFKNGTSGFAYLLKDRVGDRSELLAAIRATAAGGSVIDPTVVEAMLRRRRSQLHSLTPRETDVLAQMAAGQSNAAIGEALYLSVSAVEKNITSIFGKLGLNEEQSTHRRVAAVLAYLNDR